MAEENTNIQHLLYQIAAINKKYEQIAEITGENFNVFKILGLTTNEVRTHSAFLAELLNPKGSHGCKEAFLKLFVEKLQDLIKEQTEGSIERDNQILERIKNFMCSDKCKTYVEYHINETNEDKTVGGRIDILLRDQNNSEIIIENKIYAGEQENQLIRYYNHNQKAPIIYLTLLGVKPTSAKGLKEYEEFICISYENDILNWLNECHKEAVSKPIIRETLIQYINLIKYLTNKTTFENMKDEIKNIIVKNPEYIRSIEQCSQVIESTIYETNIKFKNLLNTMFQEQNQPKQIYYDSENNVSVVVYWNEDNDGLFFGYRALMNGKNISHLDNGIEFKKIFKEIDNNINSNQWHIAWFNPQPFTKGVIFKNFDKKEIFRMSNEDDYLKDFVLKLINQEMIISQEFIKRVESKK